VTAVGPHPVRLRGVESELEAFGIGTRLFVQEPVTFRTRIRDGRFDLALWWDEGRPLRAYDVTEPSPGSLGYGLSDPGVERSPLGKPVEPSIPAEPGATTTSGGAETVNLVELWNELVAERDVGRRGDLVFRFARWWNYDLPDAQLVATTRDVWGNVRDFEWPDPDSESYRRFGAFGMPQLYLLNAAAVRPAE